MREVKKLKIVAAVEQSRKILFYINMDNYNIIIHTPLLVLVKKDASKQDQYLFLFILSVLKRQSRSIPCTLSARVKLQFPRRTGLVAYLNGNNSTIQCSSTLAFPILFSTVQLIE